MNSLPFWKASSDLGKAVAPLLDRQLFQIGRDIAHPAGNRLLESGFTRRRSGEGPDRCSVYFLDPVTLWGFGLAYKRLYLPRKPYAPRLLTPDFPLSEIWSKRDVPSLSPPGTPDEERFLRELMGEAFRWLAAYERESDRLSRDPNESFEARWNSLADACALGV